MNVPATYEVRDAPPGVTIAISEANAVTLRGRVVDTAGKPVAGARVRLSHHIPGVGRESRYSSSRIVATPLTDADGRYTFAGCWPGDRYHIDAEGEGFTKAQSEQRAGKPGDDLMLPDLIVNRTNLTVRGTVVDAAGGPLAGVELVCVDGPKPVTTLSKPDGTFTLGSLPGGPAFVVARKAGHYARFVPVITETAGPIAVTLPRLDAPAGRVPLPAGYPAALTAFTRHLLTRMWDSHPTTGLGGSAISYMAQLDLPLAKSWCDADKKRTDGKTDWTYLVAAAEREQTLLDAAKQDLDEALAELAPLKPAAAFGEYLRLGTRLLPTDKAKALRCAEEAAVRARQTTMPARMWYLAHAGELAAQAGGKTGVAVIREAAELAKAVALTPNSREGLYVGLVASRVAPHDWPAAEELLNRITEVDEYNRFLAATLGHLAVTDFEKAKSLLDRFKPGNSSTPQLARVRVAVAGALTRPDDALKLVEAIKEGPTHAMGLIQLARKWGPTDPARAAKAVEMAFDFMERTPDAFLSYRGMGGRCGCAVVALVRASESGYPDVPSLVARTVAMLPTAAEVHDPAGREEQLVQFAAVLALIDPPTARHLLSIVKAPEAIAARDYVPRREWLFAVALTDPALGRQLLDTIMDAKLAKAGPGKGNALASLSHTGLSEFSSVLTAKDRLKDLLVWVSLSGRIDDDD